MKPLLALTALALATVSAADWFSFGGDAQRSGWQKQEKEFTPANIKDLKLRWKRKLDDTLTTPMILGPIITHRGIKELVIVAGASDNLYAVDSDLGTVFWTRHIETSAPPAASGCSAGLTASPVIGPLPPGVTVKPNAEWTPPVRPIYVVASDGKIHGIRPSTGLDGQPALDLLPPHAKASPLTLVGNILYTSTSGGCGGAPDGVWSIDIRTPGSKPKFATGETGAVAIGFEGKVYKGTAPTVFKWKDRELTATDLQIPNTNGIATWEDAKHTRWIYSATPTGITAFRVMDKAGQPSLERVWSSPEMASPVAPVIANGIVFALAEATLYALDAATGKELYNSGDAIADSTRATGLSVANGHACFATRDNTLYCFGLPLEIF
jgi:outer membrane protein assembly factor BamB